ncbi:MAG: phospholipase D-like domain-containing protein [Candidatus Bathyanammoxibius sp.]
MQLILILALICLSPAAFASTEVFFSPADDVKERLITGIKDAGESLDIASFQFTSVDVAEALIEAKDRGVRVRLVADERESQQDSSVVVHLQDEGLNVKYVKGRLGGKMHHSFMIFDSRAVFTGSYNLTEHSDKFNMENAILTDQPKLVAKYQAQFNKLYGEPVALVTAPVATKETPSAKNEPRRFIGLELSHLGNLFGKDSMLPDSEKRVLWSHAKDHFIRGEGVIVSSSVDPSAGATVVVREENGIEAEILLEPDQVKKIAKASNGAEISFTGRLLERPGATHDDFKLDRGSLRYK